VLPDREGSPTWNCAQTETAIVKKTTFIKTSSRILCFMDVSSRISPGTCKNQGDCIQLVNTGK
jgi:hypothetical protein